MGSEIVRKIDFGGSPQGGAYWKKWYIFCLEHTSEFSLKGNKLTSFVVYSTLPEGLKLKLYRDLKRAKFFKGLG